MASLDLLTAPSLPQTPPPDAYRPRGLAVPGAVGAAKRAAQDFESFFVTSMLESMTAGIKPNKMFGGGQGETLYRSLLNQEYGKAIAAGGSLGLTDSIQAEILRMQERSGN
jgi:Rod binding domain-containing protein